MSLEHEDLFEGVDLGIELYSAVGQSVRIDECKTLLVEVGDRISLLTTLCREIKEIVRTPRPPPLPEWKGGKGKGKGKGARVAFMAQVHTPAKQKIHSKSDQSNKKQKTNNSDDENGRSKRSQTPRRQIHPTVQAAIQAATQAVDTDSDDEYEAESELVDYRNAKLSDNFPRVPIRSSPPPIPSTPGNKGWVSDEGEGWTNDWPIDYTPTVPIHPDQTALIPRIIKAPDYPVIVFMVDLRLWNYVWTSTFIKPSDIKIAHLTSLTFPVVSLKNVHRSKNMEHIRRFFPGCEEAVFEGEGAELRFRSNVYSDVYFPDMNKLRVCIFPNEIENDGRFAPLSANSIKKVNSAYSHKGCADRSRNRLRPAIHYARELRRISLENHQATREQPTCGSDDEFDDAEMSDRSESDSESSDSD